MTKRIVVLAATFFALAALAQQSQEQQRPDRDPIDVQVIDGRIVVEEEVQTSEREGALLWRLVQSPGYAFPDNGIVINAEGKYDRCRVIANGQRFRCDKRGRRDPGERHKYVVNVLDIQSQKQLSLDPWILNQ